MECPKTDDLSKRRLMEFINKTRWIGQVTVELKENPVCIPGNSVTTVWGCTIKIPSKVTCLVQLAKHHNNPLNIIVNRCVATTKARVVPIILINTAKQNIWLWQPLLATELFTVDWHHIKHRANMVRGWVDINILFLHVVLNTINVQLKQVEATSSNISLPTQLINQHFVLGQIHKLQISISKQRSSTCLLN